MATTFEEQWTAHAAVFRAVARRFSAPGVDPEDVVADAYLKALDAYGAVVHFRSWAVSIIKHCAIDANRRLRSSETLGRDVADMGDAPFEERLGLRDAIRTALAEIPPQLRSVLLMVDVEQLTCRDVAEGMNLPVTTVQSRLVSARKQMRAHLVL